MFLIWILGMFRAVLSQLNAFTFLLLQFHIFKRINPNPGLSLKAEDNSYCFVLKFQLGSFRAFARRKASVIRSQQLSELI